MAPRPPRRGAAGAARDAGRHGADLRPALRRRGPPPAQARHAADAHHPGRHQRGGLRGLRRLRREEQLPVRAAGRHRVRPQDAASTRRRATPTTPASTATARRSSRSSVDRVGTPPRRERRSRPRVPDAAPPAPDGTATSSSPASAAPASSPSTRCWPPPRCAPGSRWKTLDQTGLSQKAGPVISHLRIARDALEPSNRRRARPAHCFVALRPAHRRRRPEPRATRTPSARWPSCRPAGPPTGDDGLRTTRRGSPRRQDAARADRLARTREPFTLDALGRRRGALRRARAANFLLVGAAYQSGALPIRAEAIEEASSSTASAVAANIAAFRWGRVAVADPDAFTRAVAREDATSRPVDPLPGQPARRLRRREAAAVRAAAARRPSADRALARRYLDAVERRGTPSGASTGRTDSARPSPRGCTSSLAYKDEYEVARLLTDPSSSTRSARSSRAPTCHLQAPPTARCARSAEGKLALERAGRAVPPRCSRGWRFLRGTRLDPFGYARVRRVERTLARDTSSSARH